MGSGPHVNAHAHADSHADADAHAGPDAHADAHAGPDRHPALVIPPAGTDTVPPTATLIAPSTTFVGQLPVFDFKVVYKDNFGINPANFGNGNLTVTGPTGAFQPVQLVGVSYQGSAQATVTYQAPRRRCRVPTTSTSRAAKLPTPP